VKARLVAILTMSLLCIGIGAATAPVISAGNPLQSTCVALYEDINGGGDRWAECSTLIGDTNLTGNSTNLRNGCNGANWPLTNPDWNDCVSSFGVSNLPAGFKVIFYVHANYDFRNKCVDQNGSYITNMDNVQDDRSTSYRIYTGDC
jgi:hypothetical protein